MNEAKILVGNAVQRLRDVPDQSVRTVVTSPPYWGLRDYGADGQLGAEGTPQEFVEALCRVFDEVWRVLSEDGTIWVNLGDSYAGASQSQASNNGRAGYGNPRERTVSRMGGGLKTKDLVGIPWRFAFAMQERGWYLRQDIIWSKPNPMPESVRDRCTKSHEYIFLMSKSPKYFFDLNAIAEPLAESSVRRLAEDIENQRGSFRANGGQKHIKAVGGENGTRNKRSVWNVSVARYAEAHFAVYPPELITPCVLAGSEPGDVVLDPFSGSGTTGEVALMHDRNYVGVELNPDYAQLSERRITEAVGMFGNVEVVQ